MQSVKYTQPIHDAVSQLEVIFPLKGIICPYWTSLCNSITHQAIELESFSNKIWVSLGKNQPKISFIQI